MRHLLLFIPAFIFGACKAKQAEESKPGISFKDSLVRQHLAWADSSDFYDTTEYHYRLLKAYINNDSSFFIQMKHDQDERYGIKTSINILPGLIPVSRLKNYQIFLLTKLTV